MKLSLYDILGVPADAAPDEISRAYQERMAAAVARGSDANEQVLLKEAHSILSHQNQRDVYDASQLRQAQRANSRAAPAVSDFEAPSLRWPLWLAISLVAAGILYIWLTRKPAAPKPVITERVVVTNIGPQMLTAPPATATAPARRIDKSSEELFAQLAPSTAMVTAKNSGGFSQGSAVVIGPGRLITNCHVTKGSDDIQVKIGGEIHAARVDTADEELDLCSLSVAGLSAPAVAIARVADLRTGQKVLALGAPKGLELTISEGIVSSLRELPEGTIIQTTAPISPGSSGGGLYNTAGELVGIITLTHRYGQNLNFALPADWIGDIRNRQKQTDSQSSAAVESPDGRSGGGNAQTAGERILGAWHCFRPDLGQYIDFIFQPDGIAIGTLRGQPLGGRYSVTETTLSLYDSKRWDLHIDELSGRRLVLSGSSMRLTCDRK